MRDRPIGLNRRLPDLQRHALEMALEEVTIMRGKGGEGGPGGSPFITLPGTNGEHGLEADVQSFPDS